DPATGLAFSSNGEGTLTVVREATPDNFVVVENAVTQRGVRTLALDPRTHTVFVVTAEFGPAPAPSPEQPLPRPSVVPGSFVVLVLGPCAGAPRGRERRSSALTTEDVVQAD